MQTRLPLSLFRILVVGTVTGLSACAETEPPSALGPTAELSLRTSFEGSFQAGDITQIRVVVSEEGSGEDVHRETFTVSPQASEWNLELDIDLQGRVGLSVFLTVELISVDTGSPVVEWSGRIGPFTLSPGTSSPLPVEVFPGPLANLDVTGISISAPPQTVVLEGASLSFSATLTGGGSGARVVWASSDPNVATVDQSGNVQTLRPGTAQILAQAGRQSASASVTAVQLLAGVEVVPPTITVESPGATAVFSARAFDPRDDEITDVSFAWSSVNSSIAQSLGNGAFQTFEKGTTDVTVTASTTISEVPQDPVSGQGTIIVEQGVATVTVSPSTMSFSALGLSQQATAQAFDGLGAPVSDAVFSWSSDDPSVASVNSSGVVRAEGNGTATVTVQADQATATISVTVNQVASFVGVSPSSASIETGETQQFTATVFDSNSNEMDPDVTWSVTNTSVASIDQTGLVTAIETGSTSVIATQDGATGSASLTITGPAPPVEYIAYQGLSTIEVMMPDGTFVEDTGAEGGHPTWSPDGTQIAYEPNSGNGIGVVDFPSLGPARVDAPLPVGDPLNPYDKPDWSPDGSFLAASKDLGSGMFRLSLIEVSSDSESLPLSESPVLDPDFAPSQEIAVSYQEAIWRANVSGFTAQVTSPPSGYEDRCPEWSPDGTRIAFTRISIDGSFAMLMVIDADGTNEQMIVDSSLMYPTGEFCGSAWSPDGVYIAFTGRGLSFTSDIFKVEVANPSNVMNLTNSSSASEHGPSWWPTPAPVGTPPVRR